MASEDFAAPSLGQRQRIIMCILCLMWKLNLVQSTINSTLLPSLFTESSLVIKQTTSYDDYFQESSSSELISFQHECIAHVTHLIGDDGPQTQLMCTVDGLSYRIPSVGEQWIKEQMVFGELISDETMMTLPADAMLNSDTHEIYMTEPPSLWNHEMEERERRRKLRRLATTGSKTVLVVRVQATDATSTLTAAQLGNYVFGDDGTTLNLKVQTEACSNNGLLVNKAISRTGASTSISNGIVTIPVSVATSAGETVMMNEITSALIAQFGVTLVSDLADHVMYCYPPGTTSSATVAYAILGGYMSFYNDEACSYPSAQIHEIAHNYNIGHSSDSTQEYGDKSGLMGYSYKYTDIPSMCFNAAKSWQLGWYTSKADSITPSRTSSTYTTKLAGVVDYSTTSNKVLVEIQQTSSTTFYYVNYNRATGINGGTQEGRDSVLVVSKDTSVESNVSMSQAILSSGQAFTISNFNGNAGETLTITFASLDNNEANVDIVLTGTGFPTATPSVAPSLTPSMTPSAVPSFVPSLTPSTVPSLVPSKTPSAHPTTAPSLTPSRPPSTSPSLAPSLPPSRLPSSAPSLNPSKPPSTAPSTVPSNKPSLDISFWPSKMPSTAPSILPTVFRSTGPSSKVSSLPSKMPSTAPSVLPSLVSSNRPSSNVGSLPSSAPSISPSISPNTLPSLAPSQNPSTSFYPSASIQPSFPPSESRQQSSSLAPSNQPSRAPSISPSMGLSASLRPTGLEPSLPPSKIPSNAPSKIPTVTPSVGLSESKVPSLQPTTAAGPISIERIATIVVEIGVDGLNDLDKICTGLEAFLQQGIQDTFSSTTTETSIVCTRGQNRRRAEVITSVVGSTEKPILITVTTSFADFHEAPLPFGFLGFVEELIVSEATQTQLAEYIEQAMDSKVGGVHIRLVQTNNKPILIVAFGEKPPTSSPLTSTTTPSPGSPSGAHSRAHEYLLPLLLCSVVGGVTVM